jgi:hypothetical protein
MVTGSARGGVCATRGGKTAMRSVIDWRKVRSDEQGDDGITDNMEVEENSFTCWPKVVNGSEIITPAMKVHFDSIPLRNPQILNDEKEFLRNWIVDDERIFGSHQLRRISPLTAKSLLKELNARGDAQEEIMMLLERHSGMNSIAQGSRHTGEISSQNLPKPMTRSSFQFALLSLHLIFQSIRFLLFQTLHHLPHPNHASSSRHHH